MWVRRNKRIQPVQQRTMRGTTLSLGQVIFGEALDALRLLRDYPKTGDSGTIMVKSG